MLYFLLSILLVVIDQVVKFLTRANIAPGSVVPFLPHVLGLTYSQNTGAAFSLFEEHTWALTVVSSVVTLLLVVVLARRRFVRHPAGLLCLSVVLAGSAGNLIDRALFGAVTDMFIPLFVDFAIFNVADICITLGGIASCVYVIFFYERLEGGPAALAGASPVPPRPEEPDEPPSADE